MSKVTPVYGSENSLINGFKDKFGHYFTEWHFSFSVILLLSISSVFFHLLLQNRVIESSLKNFKAFFRWLYVIVMQLMEEPIQPSISKVLHDKIWEMVMN